MIRPTEIAGSSRQPERGGDKFIKKITIMETLANINGNMNIKLNNIKTMTTISENAESQQVAGNRAEEMMASAIAHEAKMAEIKAAEEQEEKMNLRIIKIKPAGNAKMFRTLAKAIAGRGYHPDVNHPCRRGWMRLRVVRNP